jgi:hypothetical protein
MKAVLALLLVCLVQISSAEEQENIASEGNLLLQREVREAAGGKKNQGCDKKCRKALRQAQKKDGKKSRQLKKKKNKKPSRQGKKGKNGGRKAGRKTVKGRPGKKKGKKGPKDTRRVSAKKAKKAKKAQIQESNGLRSSSTSGTGRQDTCFTDMVAKTKKFNKAQVEFRLAKRVESWGKLMKNKKNNSASTFSDALEAMNEATGNGMSCDGDSSSLAEAKKVQEKLANCSTSAGDNCDEGKLSIPINSTLVSSCKTTLETFAKDFKACLTKSTDAEICSCVQALTNPGSECLDFKAMHDGVKSQKEKCTKGSEEGSFGDCRKQERMAAKFGNKCKKSCSGSSVTTQAPAASQRMKLLKRLNQKLFF